eukprot:280428-Prymnesium_polylepis.1
MHLVDTAGSTAGKERSKCCHVRCRGLLSLHHDVTCVRFVAVTFGRFGEIVRDYRRFVSLSRRQRRVLYLQSAIGNASLGAREGWKLLSSLYALDALRAGTPRGARAREPARAICDGDLTPQPAVLKQMWIYAPAPSLQPAHHVSVHGCRTRPDLTESR